MCTLMSVDSVCPSDPVVPVMRTANNPGEAVEFAVTVSSEVASPPAVGDKGERTDTATPEGEFSNHVAISVTDELNPLRENTVIVSDPLAP